MLFSYIKVERTPSSDCGIALYTRTRKHFSRHWCRYSVLYEYLQLPNVTSVG